MSSRPLSHLKINEEGIIDSVDGEAALQTRLKELGLIAGTRVRVERFAPLGDPIELEVRGYRLSIRKEDAGNIAVKPVTGA